MDQKNYWAQNGFARDVAFWLHSSEKKIFQACNVCFARNISTIWKSCYVLSWWCGHSYSYSKRQCSTSKRIVSFMTNDWLNLKTPKTEINNRYIRYPGWLTAKFKNNPDDELGAALTISEILRNGKHFQIFSSPRIYYQSILDKMPKRLVHWTYKFF